MHKLLSGCEPFQNRKPTSNKVICIYHTQIIYIPTEQLIYCISVAIIIFCMEHLLPGSGARNFQLSHVRREKYSQSTWIAYEKKSGHFSKHHTLAWLKIAQLSCVLFEETWNWGFQMKEAHCVRMDTRKHGRVQQYTHFSTWKPMLYQGSLHPPKDSKMKTRKCENTIFFSSNNIDAKLRTSRSCLSWFLISINWFSL